jgi:hypothetical protein
MTDQPRADLPPEHAAYPGAPPANRERPLPLRQMGIGEMIDGAVKLYRRDFLALIGIAAFVLIPVSFIEVWATQSVLGTVAGAPVLSDAQAFQFLWVTLVIFAAELLLIQPFLIASITRAAADAYLGEDVTVGGTYRFALSRLPAILWITILTTVAVILGFVPFLAVVAFGAFANVPILIIVGIVALAIPIYLLVRFTLTAPVLVVEDVRGTRAIGRSWRLTANAFWRLVALLILSTLIASVGQAIITIPTGIVSGIMGASGWPVAALGTAVATVLIAPFSALIVILFYFDMRIRKEGFDIEVMAQELASAQ